MNIVSKLSRVPSSPGIYIMKDGKEKAIYVGKAKNLRNRLRSYFQKSSSLDERKARMVTEIRDFDYIVTKNELEALVLEANFIKRLKPRFNVILRDDKSYPYIKLTINEEWPWLEVVRRIEKDGSLYFGPYVPASSMWEMMKFIRRNFPVRSCKYKLDKPFRPCVQYQMGRCLAPCTESLRSADDRRRYLEAVGDVRAFIQGEKRGLLSSLRDRMQRHSENLEFEEAAMIRDRIRSIEKAWESQRVISPELGDLDVIGFYREHQEAVVYLLFIRNGIVIGQRDFFFKKLSGIKDTELVSAFLEQFYSKNVLIPPRIVLPLRGSFNTERMWLSSRADRLVHLGAVRGETEEKVLKLANDNAIYSFNKHKGSKSGDLPMQLMEMLHLRHLPRRIGAVDVSNISGSEAVGALIVYEEGRFQKDGYRLFRIRAVKGIDDFAMIAEVISRYMKKISEGSDHMLDLLLIDGGIGQLEAALGVIKEYDMHPEIAAIAKAREPRVGNGRNGRIKSEFERIYIPDKRTPIYLEPSSPVTHFVQRIRDEVHRVAIGYHKKLRNKRTLESPLEKIKGIGKTRRLSLLRAFGSIDALRNATTEEIASVKGMNRKIAETLKRQLGEMHTGKR